MILPEYNGDVSAENSADYLDNAFLLAAALILSLPVVAVACFYCFYSKARKKSFADDEERSRSSASEEQLKINDNKDRAMETEERTRKVSSWAKITSLFQSQTATEELNYRMKATGSMHCAKNGNSVYGKPAMGDVRATYVQPPSRDRRFSSSSSEAAPQLKQKRNSFIPDSFKLPFEVLLMSEENSAPPQGSDYVGRLEFSVAYAFDTMTLIVKILKATDLPAMDLSGFSDPFVKCCLLPDRKRKLETKIRRKTLNPTWNETLLFEGLPYDKIQQRVLYMQVMDWDRFSRNDPIGEVCLPLNHIDLTDNAPQWEYLTLCKGSNKRGELLISLCYHPVEGKIEVEIKEARNLKPMDINGTSDPYVKIWLLVRGKRVDKKKTVTVKNCLNPTFNEKFTFASPMERLRDLQLELSVMDKDVIGRNEVIGKIYLGTKSNALEKRHWKEMLTKVRQPVEQWHILKV